MTVDAALTDAADAVDAQRWLDAATKLLEAWDDSRSERIARALAIVDLRLPPPAPLEGELVRTRETHWHALVARGDDESLRRALAAPWPTHPRQARARVAALATRLSARVSNALLALHRGSLYASRTGMRLSRSIFQLLIAAGDEAVIDELARLEQRPQEAYVLGRGLLRRKRPTRPVLAAVALDALVRIEAACAVEEREDASARDNLLAAIYAAPYDDAPRLVYADLLAEAGDPRGELITLQLRGGDDKRARKLLRAAGRSWLDGLDTDGATDIIHRRGFPAEAALSAGEVRAPAWATIETLRLGSDGTFAGGPQLRALRSLYNIAAASLSSVTLVSKELDMLVVRDLTPALPETELAPRMLGLARIPSIHGAAAIVRALPRHALARRLETVRLTGGLVYLAAVVELAEQVPFAVELPGGWDLELRQQWSIRVVGRSLSLAWHGPGLDPAFAGIVEAFQRVPLPRIETLEITGSAVGAERVAEQVVAILGKWPALKSAQIFGIRAS